jgi:hypothetical protein
MAEVERIHSVSRPMQTLYQTLTPEQRYILDRDFIERAWIRAAGETVSAKWAITSASSRSVLASRPAVRAKLIMKGQGGERHVEHLSNCRAILPGLRNG